ncbi:helix-turn-helix domain-containing protein [Rhodococcus sp. NPDC019627]|uniref:helix-turn-helix domain-containing protein n=1 Tax=unclassified Rhodococcus (in: high G+C Gram-positive bacteria) TaxID=192944 RepID=UPI0037942533
MTHPSIPALHVPKFDQADRMRKALRDVGMTVTEMAEYLGITRETAGRYMNGSAKVPLQTLRLWSLRTGVPMEWITDGVVPADLDKATDPPAKKRASTRAKKSRSLD